MKKTPQSYNVIGIFVVIFVAIITLFLVQEVSAVGRFCIKNGTICRKQIISEEQRNAASDWIVGTEEVASDSEEGGTYTITNEYCSNALYQTREACNYQFVNVSSNFSAIDGAQRLRQSVWYNREHSNRNTERYCNNGICISEFPPEFREKFVNRKCDDFSDCRYHVGFYTQAELKKLGLDDDVIAWGKDRDFGWYDNNATNRPLRGCLNIGGGDVLLNSGYRSFSLDSRELLFTQANQITGFNCSFLAESQTGLRSLMDVWLPGREKTPEILLFTADDKNEITIKSGEPVTLTWRTKQADTVEIDNNAHTRDQTWWGQTIVNPTNTTTYTLTARAGSRSTTQSVTVNVLEPITNFYGPWIEAGRDPGGNLQLGEFGGVHFCKDRDSLRAFKISNKIEEEADEIWKELEKLVIEESQKEEYTKYFQKVYKEFPRSNSVGDTYSDDDVRRFATSSIYDKARKYLSKNSKEYQELFAKYDKKRNEKVSVTREFDYTYSVGSKEDMLRNKGDTLWFDWEDAFRCDGAPQTCIDLKPGCLFLNDQSPEIINPCALTGSRIRLVNCRAGIKDNKEREMKTVWLIGGAMQEFIVKLTIGLLLMGSQEKPNAPSFTKGVENLPPSTINFKCPSCSIIDPVPIPSGPSGSVVVGQGGVDNTANMLQTVTAVRGAVQYGVSPSIKNEGQVEVKYPILTSPLNHSEAKNIKSMCSSSFERNACVKRETKFITGVDLNDDDVKRVFPSWK